METQVQPSAILAMGHGLKTVIRVTRVSADESLGSVIGGWGPAGANPRAQGGGGICE